MILLLSHGYLWSSKADVKLSLFSKGLLPCSRKVHLIFTLVYSQWFPMSCLALWHLSNKLLAQSQSSGGKVYTCHSPVFEETLEKPWNKDHCWNHYLRGPMAGQLICSVSVQFLIKLHWSSQTSKVLTILIS